MIPVGLYALSHRPKAGNLEAPIMRQFYGSVNKEKPLRRLLQNG